MSERKQPQYGNTKQKLDQIPILFVSEIPEKVHINDFMKAKYNPSNDRLVDDANLVVVCMRVIGSLSHAVENDIPTTRIPAIITGVSNDNFQELKQKRGTVVYHFGSRRFVFDDKTLKDIGFTSDFVFYKQPGDSRIIRN